VAYDYPSITTNQYLNSLYNCIYWNRNQGSVPWTLSGNFFLEDEPSTMGRRAREHFQYALSQFVESRYQSPRWFGRKGLVGWTLFSHADRGEREENWDIAIGPRENSLADWAQTMLSFMGTTETAKLGSRRLRCLDVWNLRRFKYYDTGGNQPQYLDVSENDYVDYHLNTRHEDSLYNRDTMLTDYPTDPFTPMQQFLGVKGEFTTAGCSLPEVIDHYRAAGSPKRAGFFSSGFDLFGWTRMPGEDLGLFVPPRKRLLSDCYHNYLWLAFATGSIGGPIAGPLPGGSNDLSGVTYVSPTNVTLNTYTDEILDSMLSLNRFTSLVQWKQVADYYQPTRIRHQSSDTTITLLNATTGQQMSQNDWLWTAASDKTITAGWIVRNCLRNYDVPESEDPLSTTTPPVLRVQNLAAMPLELVWFDDHSGQIVGSRFYGDTGAFQVQAPNTEGKNGFARSVAFVIQPVGLTVQKPFEPLPSYPTHMIGQIEVTPRKATERWLEELQVTSGTWLTFTARTKPPISILQGWRFDWRFDLETTQPVTVMGSNQIQRYHQLGSGYRVWVDIYNPSSQRVCGDRIEIAVR